MCKCLHNGTLIFGSPLALAPMSNVPLYSLKMAPKPVLKRIQNRTNCTGRYWGDITEQKWIQWRKKLGGIHRLTAPLHSQIGSTLFCRLTDWKMLSILKGFTSLEPEHSEKWSTLQHIFAQPYSTPQCLFAVFSVFLIQWLWWITLWENFCALN